MPTAKSPEFEAFDRAIGQLLSVSHDEMKRRMEAYKEEADKNPKKRGPKKRASRPQSAHQSGNS